MRANRLVNGDKGQQIWRYTRVALTVKHPLPPGRHASHVPSRSKKEKDPRRGLILRSRLIVAERQGFEPNKEFFKTYKKQSFI